MRKALISLLAFSATTVGAQPQPNIDVCKLMSVEEMQLCQATRPGDPTGARSARCDELSREAVQKCLDERRDESSASGGTTTPAPEDAAPRIPPPKELPPDEQ